MQESNGLALELEHGDYERLAEITGFSKVYVRQVIHGERTNETIINAAQDYKKLRNDLKAKYCRPLQIEVVAPTKALK